VATFSPLVDVARSWHCSASCNRKCSSEATARLCHYRHLRFEFSGELVELRCYPAERHALRGVGGEIADQLAVVGVRQKFVEALFEIAHVLAIPACLFP